MSYRVYVGKEKTDWADYDLADYLNLRELARACAWKLPLKIFYSPPFKHKADRLGQCLRVIYEMKDFSVREVAGNPVISGPGERALAPR